MNKQEIIEKMYDIIDGACQFLFTKKINYLDSLFNATEYLLNHDVDIAIAEDDYQTFCKILDEVEELSIDVDGVRKVMQYLILSAFKESKIPNSYMTPEVVGIFVAYLARKFYTGSKPQILDLAIGTGNLLSMVANSFDDCILYGVDCDELMVRIAKMNTAMQDYDCLITLGDVLETPYQDNDLVIGDLDRCFIEDAYFPHLAIKAQWQGLKEEGYMILVVPNDFFDYEKFSLPNMQMVGLLVLPKMGVQKSIVIIQKSEVKVENFLMVELPSLENASEMDSCIKKIEQWFKRRKTND